MTNKKNKKYTVIKFGGSIALALTVVGVLLSAGGQLDFLGSDEPQIVPPVITHKEKKKDEETPKYSFYDELKKRKTELDNKYKSSSVKNVVGSDNNKYVVQVGAFRIKADAEKVKGEIASLGYPVLLAKSTSNKFLVQAGPFKGRNHAVQVEKKLIRQKFDTLIKLHR